jgi:hypothetical protein
MAWWNTHITQPFKWTFNNVKGHDAIDLHAPNGTPLTSAVAGVVKHAGAHPWGGQVSIVFDNFGRKMTLTYLHMSDIAPGIQPGVQVRAGQYIGKSGGGTYSVPIPTSSTYSTGPHLHWELWLGDHAPYVDQSPWRPDAEHHPVDPTSMFYVLRDTGIPDDQSAFGLIPSDPSSDSSWQTDSGYQGPTAPGGGQRAHAILQEAPGFYGIVRAMDTAETFNPWQPPKPSVPATAGDIQIQLGPLTENIHIPGVSDLANAAAQARSASNIAGYTTSWLINNVTPLLVRIFLILLGLGLIFALIYAQVRRSEIVQTLAPNPTKALQALAVAGRVAA